MGEVERSDICVIGNGAAGVAVATGAALLGVRVALIGNGTPEDGAGAELAVSTLLAMADTAARITRAADLELGPLAAAPDLAQVQRHIEAVVATAAAAGAPERLQALGVRLLEGDARFVGPSSITIDGLVLGDPARTITARRFVIAAGGRAVRPPIPGLDRVPFLTPGTLAMPDRAPGHLVVLGSGADALELAQAYRRLGSAVTVIADGAPLADEDPELVDLLLLRLRAEGIEMRAATPVQAVAEVNGALHLTVGPPAAAETIVASHLLVAAGRRTELAQLGLEAAGVAVGSNGIAVDRHLRTGNRRIYALGDAIGPDTGAAGAAVQAAIVLRNILFRQRARLDPQALPRIVRTDPGLAQIGLSEQDARQAGLRPTILRSPFHDNDRARAEVRAHGLIKVITTPRGRILGAGIVGPNADELIQIWQLAIAQRLKVAALAGLITPYPTLGEASKRAAGGYFAPKLLGAGTRRLVRWLAKLG
ncbi:dihydrolipoamide dehydrogenase [Aliidongia dinghuensis]|uniref:Dihydrolipoamide dehydrogenase n=1 Tax=Aliidongia dinghuensis TaxID=1867774 RepID=A0A8J2YR19_9PROT|nr:FAD-dependent oxidoreductase [Aliidongia dinghuensis]GGF09399.1 dihydrolipoamide dehydrogenase [Aliidongia dinghuensis]